MLFRSKKLEPDAKIIYKHKEKNKFNAKLFVDCLTLSLGVSVALIAFLVNMPIWAYYSLFVLSTLLIGWKTYYKAATLLFRGTVNENLLVTISVIGAAVVGEGMEAVMVVALYSLGKIFEGLAVDHSRKSIAALVKLQPDFAVILNEGKEEKVRPEEVIVGSHIIVRAGEKVAIDGIISKGKVSVDMQSLTGESLPVSLEEGDEILSGAIVLDGMIEIETTKHYRDSAIKKIMDLTEKAQENKSKTETFISKITKWYTLGIVFLALLVWGIVWAVTKNIDTAVYRGLIFLVISCPCAFAISVPLAYFSGLGNASKNGILIKGSNHLDACAKLDTVVFDKTGTLTTGKFSVDKIEVEGENSEDEILFLAATGEQYSIHPLAKSIVAFCNKKLPKVKNVKEIAGKGLEFEYKSKKYFVGRKSEDLQGTAVELFEENRRLGIIFLSDTIKSSSFAACESLKNMGIRRVMLSGDNHASVVAVSDKLKLDEAHSKLLPEEKYAWIEKAKLNKNVIGYVGDGINDAPSLGLADVGISMGINGSPASVEASDIVLVDDDPEKVAKAVDIAKYTKKIVIENIALSAVIKILFLILGSLGVTGMLSAVFADVGVTLIAILNSLRALKHKAKSDKQQKEDKILKK